MSNQPALDREAGEQIDDPIEYFLQDLDYHGRSQRTRTAYRRVLEQFETFLDDEFDISTVSDARHRECLAWLHDQRGGTADSTVATYASYLNRFYDYMARVGVVDENPMELVMAEMAESIDTDPSRRDLSVPVMRSFIRGIRHPLDRVILVTLLKTGMRVGELSNLDLRDLCLDTGEVAESYGVAPRGQLDSTEHTLFVDADVHRSEIVNGERRSATNKRKRSTLIPVDTELQQVLRAWLAVRPDAPSDAEPLFVSTRDEWGQRITPEMVRSRIEHHARGAGWYTTGGGAEENVTPHYFRHFFTTHLRDRTGDRGIVKYLRGDVAEDIIDTYTHNWGDRVRSVYEANIYSIL